MRRCLALLAVVLLSVSVLAEVKVSSIKYGQKAERYSIEMAYPQLSLPAAPKMERALNHLLERDAKKKASGFIADFEKEGKDLPGDTPPWSLSSDFKLEYQNPRLLVLTVNGYVYTGGAHGMPILEIYLLDLKLGKRIPVKGLFVPGAEYLKVLSQATRKKLLASTDFEDKDWVKRGTEPTAENFPNLIPTRKGLLVTFSPYQVAPYSSGMPEVVVPYASLRSMLEPNWQLVP